MSGVIARIALLAKAKEPNPLIPATNELVWGTIAFLLLLLLLWRVGVFKRIVESLRARTEAIEGNIEKARQEREEAERLLQQYREQLDQARDEAARIMRDAREAAEQLRKEQQARAQEEANRIIESARQEIRAERDRTARELRREVATLAVQVAERVVGGSLDGDRQLQLVDGYIEELSPSSAADGNGNGKGNGSAGGGS